MDNRLNTINSYHLIGTPPDEELDEITELASIVCDTPISLITILDDEKQWFKSTKGLVSEALDIKHSFCRYTLQKPNEVLVVKDALKDERFINNIQVLGDPHIRFYAGAPLVTKDDFVLGTLCIVDRKPRKFSKKKQRALQILAKKAMKIIENHKTFAQLHSSVRLSIQRLTKITENVPLGIFELEVADTENLKFNFVSAGIKKLHPHIDVEAWTKDANIGFSVIHPDDVEPLKSAIANSVENQEQLSHEYRVKTDSGYEWHVMEGQPNKAKNGNTVIYGAFSDVTFYFEYASALEQISFDISHVLRRPVASILGISNILSSEEELSAHEIKEYSRHIKTVSEELDEFTQKLNDIYSEKSSDLTLRKVR